MLRTLRVSGLLGKNDPYRCEPLAGGVSSEIWKISTPRGTFCAKRALAKLKVEQDWRAPVERNAFEVVWCEIANAIAPGTAPRIIARDQEAMLYVMEYLDPAEYRLWKDELRAGRANRSVASGVGARLALIHAATANDGVAASRLPRNDIFQAIRLEPYLEATAHRHPDLHDALCQLSRGTAATRIAMIHGDVSPKNILIGPRGPVFLDAECACIGDPAFDLAFCLNHLLLKCLWNPSARSGYFACFDALTAAYRAGIDWEEADVFERRAARLLPGLLLARVDGKSPVEYVTESSDRDHVRHCARTLLKSEPDRLDDVASAWQAELDE